MKKRGFVYLSVLTAVSLLCLVIALTDKTSVLYNYRMAIAVLFLMFGGFMRLHVLSNKKNNEK